MGSVSASLLGVNGSTLLVDSYRWTYEKFCAICLTLPSVELRQDRSFGDTKSESLPQQPCYFRNQETTAVELARSRYMVFYCKFFLLVRTF